MEVSFDEWEKLDIRVGKILKVEDIEGADKLYKFTVDIGKEKRTLVAGLKNHYKAEELLGKQVVVLANLEKKKLKGIESQGMILAAGSKEDDICILISPEKQVSPGTRIS